MGSDIGIVLIVLINAFQDCKQLQICEILEFLQEKYKLMKVIYRNSRRFMKEY